MKKLALGLLLCSVTMPAMAQMMPAPRSAPHTPVNREMLAERHAAATRDVEGPALILDGEKLRIGEVDIRLFGVVPPQLSASFGPQARATLDALIGGGQTVSCHIRDRDHDGRLLATCRSATGADPALELLRRGLAVAARGSIAETELAQPYVSAELAAQNEKAGLWSVATPAPAAVTAAPAVVPTAKVEAAPVKAEDVTPKSNSSTFVAAKVADNDSAKGDAKSNPAVTSLFARYQILLAGALMLATALSILGAVAFYRAKEKRDEMRALAAALRGELLAARAVCLTRMKTITSEQEDRAASWPRIRSTLYQAYVGKIGWLGAELARQVASIYGQASDYASYYNNLNDNSAVIAMPKRQALQTLAAHIEEVLPRLAGIEMSGRRLAAPLYASATQPSAPVVTEPAAPMMAITSARPVAPEKIAVETPVKTEETENLETRLRNTIRYLRERFADSRTASDVAEEPMGDYTSIIEEDMERFSLGEVNEDDTTVGKIGRS